MYFSQVNSAQVTAMERYSASAEDLETTDYFLDFQEIKEEPRKIQ
jgi:hypothetical protein